MKDLLSKGPSLVYFKPGLADRLLQSQVSLYENHYNCCSGRFWRTGVQLISFHCSSCNYFQITALEDAHQQAWPWSPWSCPSTGVALKYTIEVPFDNKSFTSIRNHYEPYHSKKVVWFCFLEENSSCMWRDLLGISLFISKIRKHCRVFVNQKHCRPCSYCLQSFGRPRTTQLLSWGHLYY